MRRLTLQRSGPLVAAVLLLVVGCDGGRAEGDSRGADAPSLAEAAYPAGETSPRNEPSGPPTEDPDEPQLSPLEEILGRGSVTFEPNSTSMSLGSDASEPTEEFIRERRDAEESIAACMADHGFEYVPYVETEWPMLAEEFGLPPDEFAATYGYGITTLEIDGVDPDNPNHDIFAALSPAAQEEYNRAMHGDGGSQPRPEADRGCLGGSAVVLPDPDADPMELHMEFGQVIDDIVAVGERLANDPRVVEANEEWIDCMAEAGYPGFLSLSGAEESVVARLIDYGGEWSMIEPLDPQQLADLRDYEIAIATLDLACRTAHVDETFNVVRLELETAFVEQHRTDLERLRDWLADRSTIRP